MKVILGPYKNAWVGPYQLADVLQYVGVSEDKCYEIGEWLASTWVNPFCEFIYKHNPFKHRKLVVKIDRWDSWNANDTLAIIILPLLKQLKEDKHGAPFTDSEDVPDSLKAMNAPRVKDDWDTDDFHFDRWDWIMDEMVWSFEQLQPSSDWESLYYTGDADLQFIDLEDGMSEMVHGPNDTSAFDKDGYTTHYARIQNGLRLFGKYYLGMWT